VHSILAIGIAAFLMPTVVWPLDRAYSAWKKSRPEVILYRNWRGKLVRDLRVKRRERAAIGLVIAFGLFGLACGWVIMTQ
jgi:hypothetical protein